MPWAESKLVWAIGESRLLFWLWFAHYAVVTCDGVSIKCLKSEPYKG